MDVPDGVLLALVALLVVGWIVAVLALRRLARASSRQRSLSTRYGQLTEQYAPWMSGWPFEDARGFRFVGDPIDGVHFDDDAVYLVEVKTATSRLSPRQRALREAVLAGRVGWVEYRVDGKGEARVERPWQRK